jgi:anti-sigma regulatory factor (Ser/Thr protein kinase)
VQDQTGAPETGKPDPTDSVDGADLVDSVDGADFVDSVDGADLVDSVDLDAHLGSEFDPEGYAVDVVAAMAAFDSSAESVAQARRLVERQLDDWGQSDLSDDARLVVSELLTNAALHAKPPIKLRMARLPAGVRLEVSDGSPEVPLKVRAGSDVMTGRGWSLVEALCDSWGVQPAGRGKVVWATLLPPRIDPAEIPAAFESHIIDAELVNLSGQMGAEEETARYQVTLGDVPTDLLLAAKAHIDALIREFALLASGAAGGATSPLPGELSSLIQRVVGNFSEARQSIKKQALHASERGQARTQLTLNLPLSAAQAGQAYLAALDEVDAYCRAERMLTLETPAAHKLFRTWYVQELIAGLRQAADSEHADPDHVPESFETRLLREYQRISAD